jgi:hypothetical protein
LEARSQLSWSDAFDDPIPAIKTLRDAADLIQKLPKAQQQLGSAAICPTGSPIRTIRRFGSIYPPPKLFGLDSPNILANHE